MDNNNSKRRYMLKSNHHATDKLTCPQCGEKKSFSLYFDTRTWQPVSPEVGKCDHENRCGYNLTPWEYFKQHPEARDNNKTMPTYIPAQKPKPRLYLPENVIGRYSTDYMQSNFGRWLAMKAPSAEVLARTVEMYRLTATTTGAIIFWYIDHNGRFCQGKMMWYNTNGHRDRWVSSISFDLAKKGLMPEGANMERCLFGAHLLKGRPDAKVFLVESEKTAVVMSMLQPEYIWLAAGGCSWLGEYVVHPLKGRRVIIMPDSGCLERWQKIMAQTRGINYSFYAELEKMPKNSDILDALFPGE